MNAIILAGGLGTRLAPLTKVFPKPLMPIQDRPILDILLEQLSNFGIKKVTLAVGYKAEMIRTYFGNSKYNIDISYSFEKKRLGTAGPISLVKGLKKSNKPFFVMNADVLTTLNFSDFMEYHKSNGSLLTIASCRRDEKISLGVLKSDKSRRVKEIIEKPIYKFYVSMGIYVMEPKILEYIPKNIYQDIPNLINKLIKENKIVKEYRTSEFWMDIGRLDDYNKVQESYDLIKDRLFIK